MVSLGMMLNGLKIEKVNDPSAIIKRKALFSTPLFGPTQSLRRAVPATRNSQLAPRLPPLPESFLHQRKHLAASE